MSQPFPPPGEYDPSGPQDASPYAPGPSGSGPYGSGPSGSGPYGQWPSMGPREHPQGVTILVLGILSLAVCGLLGPVAWVMGSSALTEIDANPSAYTNRSSVQAGKICGIISTVILVVGILAVLAVGLAGSGDT